MSATRRLRRDRHIQIETVPNILRHDTAPFANGATSVLVAPVADAVALTIRPSELDN